MATESLAEAGDRDFEQAMRRILREAGEPDAEKFAVTAEAPREPDRRIPPGAPKVRFRWLGWRGPAAIASHDFSRAIVGLRALDPDTARPFRAHALMVKLAKARKLADRATGRKGNRGFGCPFCGGRCYGPLRVLQHVTGHLAEWHIVVKLPGEFEQLLAADKGGAE